MRLESITVAGGRYTRVQEQTNLDIESFDKSVDLRSIEVEAFALLNAILELICGYPPAYI
jgi:hypothetical protein